MRRAVVESIGHYLPERVVENSEFETTLETNDSWIRSRTGIERRHFAAEGETTSAMGIKAAQAALNNAGCSVWMTLMPSYWPRLQQTLPFRLPQPWFRTDLACAMDLLLTFKPSVRVFSTL